MERFCIIAFNMICFFYRGCPVSDPFYMGERWDSMTNFLIKHFVKDHAGVQQPQVRAAYGKMAGWVGICCNLLLFVAKILAGLLSGSISIMADAVNNLSDASSSVITLAGFKMAMKPADKEHPFGHARFEYVAGLVVAVLVMVIGIELARSSIERIINPAPVTFGLVSFLVLGASILLKTWMALFNRNIARRIDSTVLTATSADSRNDAITTTAVLAAAVIARFTGVNLDGWMGLAVAVFIVISGIGLVKDTLDPLLGQAPDPKLVKYVAEKISSYPGVLGTHDLMVHDYGPGRRFASAHVEMASDADVLLSHDIIDNIERDFLKQDNIHLVIHYDPIAAGDEAVGQARGFTEAQVKKIDPRLTIHDFRMVEGPSHTNYIFDVVVPPDFPLAKEELLSRIEKAVQHGENPINTVVTVDDSYAPIPS